MGIRVAETLKPWHQSSVDTLKLDAPLAAMMSKAADLPGDALVDVSVRMHGPLSSDQLSELSAMGVEGADTRRRVFTARISRDALRALASKPWVFRISLAQELRPLVSG